MPGGNVAAEKSFSTLVREIDENLRLTLRSQEALGTAACSPAKVLLTKTDLATPCTSGCRGHSSKPQAGENSFGAANSADGQQRGARKPGSASDNRGWLPNGKESRGAAGGRKQQAAATQYGSPRDSQARKIPSRQHLDFGETPDQTPQRHREPSRTEQVAKAALPVSPQHGHPFWIANELAEFDTPDSQEGRSSSGRLGSQRQSSSAGGERRKERFGSPIHQGHGHAFEKENDSASYAQRSTSPADNRLALSVLPERLWAGEAAPSHYDSQQLEAVQQQAMSLACEAHATTSAVEDAFFAAEQELKELHRYLEAGDGEFGGSVTRSKHSGYHQQSRGDNGRGGAAMSQQLREQTEECQRLEAALNETCICLAKALRSVARLEIDNDDLRDRLAASEQAGAATTQKPVGVAPVKGEPLGEADAHLGPSGNPPPSTAGQLSRQTPTGIESTATLARVCAVGATCPGIHQAALSPKQLESCAGNGLGSKVEGKQPKNSLGENTSTNGAASQPPGRIQSSPSCIPANDTRTNNPQDTLPADPQAKVESSVAIEQLAPASGQNVNSLHSRAGGNKEVWEDQKGQEYAKEGMSGHGLPHSQAEGGADIVAQGREPVGHAWQLQQRPSTARGKSSWDLPSPPGLSEKAADALRLALDSIRRHEESGEMHVPAF